MLDNIIERIEPSFSKKVEFKTVSLLRKNTNWVKKVIIVQMAIYIGVLVLSMMVLTSWQSGLVILVPLFSIFLIVWINRLSKKTKIKIKEKLYWRDLLIGFLENNNLYEESIREIRIKDNDGNYKIRKEKYVSSSAIMAWCETSEKITIVAYRMGDKFDTSVMKLDLLLEGLLNLSLEEKIVKPGYVQYIFYTKKPERLVVSSNNSKEYIDSPEINLGYGTNYSPAKAPHILLAGGTGSGKSIFISFMLLELLKREASLYIADPKNSDLGSLSHYLGKDRVATTPNNIARIVRLAVEEMNERYEHMNQPENFQYGSNFIDHSFKQVWLVFDEMGAFQASGTDKQSKAIVNEVMDGIKQIILLGRQAGVFILVAAQQMSANTLNTDLRDNLGLRIALGANSSEGYRMVMGSATPETIPSLEVKGSGLLYMQGSGKESAQYYEAPYMNPSEIDFIKELQKYI